MAKQNKLAVFAHLEEEFVPAGILALNEENTAVIASEFAYGLKYLARHNAIEIDPVSLVYNIFVSNDDDHPRNHGFLWDPAIKGWRLSPLYDVMPRPTVSTERYLFLGVGQSGRLATLDNAMTAKEMFNLSTRDAAAIIMQI